MAGADSKKSIVYALAANTAIAVAKFVAAAVTGSGAMLAEAVHSVADAGNQGLLLFGMKASKRQPSDDYPLGYGKEIYFWSFVVALILFTMGGVFSIYEGIHKLHEPEPLTAPWVAIGVLLFAIIAEGLSMAGCLREVNKVLHGRGYWQWFRESRQSELLVIFGEDLAALLGLVLALGAVSLTLVTGNPLFDAFGTIGIGTLLIAVAIGVGIEVKALLIGQGVESRDKNRMLDFLSSRPEIKRLFNLLTLNMGQDVMVAIKAEMSDYATPLDMVKAINACEAAFRAEFPAVSWLFFEPDIKD